MKKIMELLYDILPDNLKKELDLLHSKMSDNFMKEDINALIHKFISQVEARIDSDYMIGDWIHYRFALEKLVPDFKKVRNYKQFARVFKNYFYRWMWDFTFEQCPGYRVVWKGIEDTLDSWVKRIDTRKVGLGWLSLLHHIVFWIKGAIFFIILIIRIFLRSLLSLLRNLYLLCSYFVNKQLRSKLPIRDITRLIVRVLNVGFYWAMYFRDVRSLSFEDIGFDPYLVGNIGFTLLSSYIYYYILRNNIIFNKLKVFAHIWVILIVNIGLWFAFRSIVLQVWLLGNY